MPRRWHRSRPDREHPRRPSAVRAALAPLAGARTLVVGLAVVLYSVGAPVSAAVHDVPVDLALSAVLLQCGGLVVALWRAQVGTVAALTGVVMVAVSADRHAGPWPWTVPSLLTFGALLAVLGVRREGRLALTAWIASLVVTGVIALVVAGGGDGPGTNLVVYASNSALLLGGGVAVGARRRVREELARSRRDTEAEQARRVIVEERNRIARELHDVVAHSMSVIGVQATTAQYRIPGLSAEARAEFDDIAAQSRTALAEMRTLLGVLRSSGDGAELAPQAGLDGLDALAEGARRAGCAVTLHLDPPLRLTRLPASVGLVVHRIVQEGLANVVRHATGAAVGVSVLRADPGIVVEVRNDAPPPGFVSTADPGGHGLVGVRERAALLGGTVESGPLPGGGFVLRAALPWEAGA
ncbi:sensor histidine kinase [Kineococcus sp. SYSU DK001]|uniref:sensor histidine kinase n=1 Tax=Kineococcus sp. SYSU DK001 TaxID=3383122 RepID=UPI003D7DB3B7